MINREIRRLVHLGKTRYVTVLNSHYTHYQKEFILEIDNYEFSDFEQQITS